MRYCFSLAPFSRLLIAISILQRSQLYHRWGSFSLTGRDFEPISCRERGKPDATCPYGWVLRRLCGQDRSDRPRIAPETALRCLQTGPSARSASDFGVPVARRGRHGCPYRNLGTSTTWKSSRRADHHRQRLLRIERRMGLGVEQVASPMGGYNCRMGLLGRTGRKRSCVLAGNTQISRNSN